MATTPNLALTQLTEGQINSETTVNSTINTLDAFTSLRIEDQDLTAPPGSPANGKVYWIKVGTTPSGDWLGKAGKLAIYNSGWTFYSPVGGMSGFIHDEGIAVYYHSQATEWVPMQPRWLLTEHFTGRYGEGGVAAVGKIYKKCFQGLACPNATTVTHAHSITNLELGKFLNIEASITTGTALTEMNLTASGSSRIYCSIDATNISITAAGNYSTYTADISLEYQKTS